METTHNAIPKGHYEHVYNLTNMWLHSPLLHFLCPGTCLASIHGSTVGNADVTKYFSIGGAPMARVPGVPFTSHNNGRILSLGSDEVHSNHCCQVIHTHLVDTRIQLDFV